MRSVNTLKIGQDRPLVALPVSGDALTLPHARLAALATHLVERHNALVFLTGATGDHAQAHAVMKLLGAYARRAVIDFTGQLDLAALGALIESADVLITGDTALMALGAAVKTPVVALFADPSLAATARPWEMPHIVMADVTPEMLTPNMIAEACATLLAEVTAPAGLGLYLRDVAALAPFEAADVI